MKIVAEFEETLNKYPAIAPGTPVPYTPPEPGSRALQWWKTSGAFDVFAGHGFPLRAM
jgi:hypothetical protein